MILRERLPSAPAGSDARPVRGPRAAVRGLALGTVLLVAWLTAALPAAAEPAAASAAAAASIAPAAPGDGVTRVEREYLEPDAVLRDVDGHTVALRALLEADRPVMLDFIYTSCTAICPMLSETFAQVQRALGADAAGLRMVSISIDPEVDTPKVLRAYAQPYHPGPQWLFLTGSAREIVDVQTAFDAYKVNKMDHASLILLRAGRRHPWIRYEGPVTPATLVREVRAIQAAAAPSR